MPATTSAAKPEQELEKLRQELLRLILKNEDRRRITAR
jgi:hypothetical protein